MFSRAPGMLISLALWFFYVVPLTAVAWDWWF